jgi:hypothetical protein
VLFDPGFRTRARAAILLISIAGFAAAPVRRLPATGTNDRSANANKAGAAIAENRPPGSDHIRMRRGASIRGQRDAVKRSIMRHLARLENDYKIIYRPKTVALRHRLNLRVRQNNIHNIRSGHILLFSTLRNEALRIPYFLDYYRRLGVEHFLFVDNGSTDDFAELVAGKNDISVWYTTASYRASNFGMHWLNALLWRYGCGHWCVTVDPDEFLIYPFYETRSLLDLTAWLDGQRRPSLFCLVLDMYSDRRVSETHCRTGEDPLTVAPYFDGTGYVQHFATPRGEVFTQGGPRRRIFFRHHPEAAPALNKTPLVRWQRNYSYLSSMHQLSHMRLNWPHGPGGLSPTGCLLHFKFLSSLPDKAAEELARKEHYDNSKEYVAYHKIMDSGDDYLYYESSIKFENSAQLVELGFMQRGTWF